MQLTLNHAAELLAQLGNETRLKIIRHLVKAGDAGAPVGEIQSALKIPASTLSHHLRYLRNIQLISQDREGAVLQCRVNYRLIDAVTGFLTEQCCTHSATNHRAA